MDVANSLTENGQTVELNRYFTEHSAPSLHTWSSQPGTEFSVPWSVVKVVK